MGYPLELNGTAKAGRIIARFKDEEFIDKVHENTIRKKDLYKLRSSVLFFD
ncbi:hypothetical protein [Natranaerobius trueperi]|uniref:hypothetical protein n=1 Tax=Natranaerobius trueperi TaxID=759412 RepID=UPI00146C4C19|nr:hypothetical protein [Natranaerobius trueperi]